MNNTEDKDDGRGGVMVVAYIVGAAGLTLLGLGMMFVAWMGG